MKLKYVQGSPGKHVCTDSEGENCERLPFRGQAGIKYLEAGYLTLPLFFPLVHVLSK